MKQLTCVLGLTLAAASVNARQAPGPDSYYQLGPDSFAREGVPRGTLKGPYTLPSDAYPGTQHTYWVYVPAQYQPTVPASLMIFNDGQAFKNMEGDLRVPNVLDNLIWRREIPVMIGVFINPGRRPDQPEPTPQEWGDRTTNRPAEYNTLDDKYARVIVDELMPALYKEYNLSTDPERHGIGGASSGAIAAFTVAWERPNHFRKVLSLIGSFVDLRGGHAYADIVRKSSKKPIRIYLQDGRNDNRERGSGGKYDEARDWFFQNVRLMQALSEKGYDVNYSWGIGRHSQKHGGAILPDMLRWLWRDHPVSTDVNDVVERSFNTPAEKTESADVVAWTNGRWFDGTAFRAIEVYSAGDRLTLKRPAHVDRTVDLGGRYVTSAFAEAHNHNIPSGGTSTSIRKYLEQGIFYVMIQANVPEAPGSLKGTINTPESVDVAFANGCFTAPDGHPSALVARNIANGGMTRTDLDGGFLHPVVSPGDVERAWSRRIASQHPDFIKMILTYSEDRVSGRPRPTDSDRHGLDPSLAPVIVQKAHAAGLRVSAHVESAYDFDVAVRAGADVIAHMPGFWPDPARIGEKGLDLYKIGADSARRAGERGVRVITTIGESLRYVQGDPQGVKQREPLLALYRHNIGILQKHGVVIAIGSDQFRDTSIQEALDIEKAGLMTPAAVLRALSSDGAATIFPTRAPFGLAEGAPADFLVLDGNPLKDFTAITRITRGVKGGRQLLPRRAD